MQEDAAALIGHAVGVVVDKQRVIVHALVVDQLLVARGRRAPRLAGAYQAVVIGRAGGAAPVEILRYLRGGQLCAGIILDAEGLAEVIGAAWGLFIALARLADAVLSHIRGAGEQLIPNAVRFLMHAQLGFAAALVAHQHDLFGGGSAIQIAHIVRIRLRVRRGRGSRGGGNGGRKAVVRYVYLNEHRLPPIFHANARAARCHAADHAAIAHAGDARILCGIFQQPSAGQAVRFAALQAHARGQYHHAEARAFAARRRGDDRRTLADAAEHAALDQRHARVGAFPGEQIGGIAAQQLVQREGGADLHQSDRSGRSQRTARQQQRKRQ